VLGQPLTLIVGKNSYSPQITVLKLLDGFSVSAKMGRERMIAAGGRRCNQAESYYPSWKGEMMALVTGIGKWGPPYWGPGNSRYAPIVHL